MKLLQSASAFALLFELSLALPKDYDGNALTRDLLEKRQNTTVAKDCGEWKMKCKNAAGACNNACYYVNCIAKSNKFTYGEVKGIDNRIHSGCTTSFSGSWCKASPFSMRSWDQAVSTKPLRLQCDEFPMNAFKQDAYVDGTHRNSLRCIDGSENGSGGSQFGQFRAATGDWKEGGKLASSRTCKGEMKQDDTFSVGFIIDGEDGIPTAEQPIRVPYCMPNPDCLNDGFQYHMSKLDQHGNERGQLSQPYNYNGDNHYALSTIGDLRLYRIKILRHSDKALDITIYEKNGEELIEKKKQTDSPDYDKWLTVDDAFPKQYLSVRTNGPPGSVLKLQISTRHGSKTQTEFAEGDFAFKSDEQGIAGAYCYVEAPNPISITSQLMYCDVPVLA